MHINIIGINERITPIVKTIHVGYSSHNKPYIMADNAAPPVENALTIPKIAPLLLIGKASAKAALNMELPNTFKLPAINKQGNMT